MLRKLRLRFIGINMAIVTGMLLIIFGLVFHFTQTDLENKSNVMLQSLTQSVRDFNSIGQNIQLPYFVLQINTWGEVIASGNTHYDISDADFIQELIQHVYTADSATGIIGKYNLKYSIISGLGVQKLCFLDVSSHELALTSLLQTCFFIGLLALTAFTFISILLAKWAVKPVEKAWLQQKQFISDASHELKTPLTVIMSNAEMLQSSENDCEAYQRFTENISTSATQMRSLVEGMLELTRADNGQIRTSFEPVDLSKIVLDSALPFEPVFFENGMILQSNIEPDIQIIGSSQHLRQLTNILLDNAKKYSDPGIIDLTLHRHGRNQCLLTVANPGAPIAKEDLKKIFERFYRTDNARSNTGSFGLGLSIAQRITQEHNGMIWAESNHTGNRFCVTLPCK